MKKKSDPQDIASQIAYNAFKAVETAVPDSAQQQLIYEELASHFNGYAKLLAAERKKPPEQIAAEAEITRDKLLKIARGEVPERIRKLASGELQWTKATTENSAASEIARRQCRHGDGSHPKR